MWDNSNVWLEIESSLIQILMDMNIVELWLVKRIIKQLTYPNSSRKLRLPSISKLKMKPERGEEWEWLEDGLENDMLFVWYQLETFNFSKGKRS